MYGWMLKVHQGIGKCSFTVSDRTGYTEDVHKRKYKVLASMNENY